MTQDVIALTPQLPETRTLPAGLLAGGPDLLVNRAGDGSVAQLCTAAGQALVSLEAPRYLQVPGEVARLLGPDVHAESPVWWTEARATSAVEGAGRLAGSLAGRVAAVHYALGDGTDPAAWQRLRQINAHVTAGTSEG